MTIGNAKIAVNFDISQYTAFDLRTVTGPLQKLYSWLLTNGTGAGQIDKLWADTRTTSGNDDLDVNGAAITDEFGGALAFARVKFLFVKAADANVGNVLVGAAAANGLISPFGSATDKLVLRPGAAALVAAGSADATGYVSTAATADILRVAASTGSVTYDIVIGGCSA
jgi:hypothetical protein